jgi:hypothetical protein
MIGAKRKYYQLDNTVKEPITKIRKLPNAEYEEINLYSKLNPDSAAIDNLTGSINELSIKKKVNELFYNTDNPEKIELERKTKIKKMPNFSYLNLNTEKRVSFKKAFEETSGMKSTSDNTSKLNFNH